MSYDVRCYDLAKTFLQREQADQDRLIAILAQDIQDTIEDFLFWEIHKGQKSSS